MTDENEIRPMEPKGFEADPRLTEILKTKPVNVEVTVVSINDRVHWFDLLRLFVKESVITEILTMQKGVTMGDYKTTIAGAVAALAQVLGLLGLGIPVELITIITAIAVAAFGLFAKDKASSTPAA